jgi:hypothetical protein
MDGAELTLGLAIDGTEDELVAGRALDRPPLLEFIRGAEVVPVEGREVELAEEPVLPLLEREELLEDDDDDELPELRLPDEELELPELRLPPPEEDPPPARASTNGISAEANGMSKDTIKHANSTTKRSVFIRTPK